MTYVKRAEDGEWGKCVDLLKDYFEMGAAWRTWSKKYGDQWEEKFRLRIEKEMIEKYDTHLYVGTLHQHPGSWIIVGLFYPPRSSNPKLF